MRWTSVLMGALAGGAVGAAVWWYAERKLDENFRTAGTRVAASVVGGSAQLQRQFDVAADQMRAEVIRQVWAQVPPAVNASVVSTLGRYGITPAMAQQLTSLIAEARRRGLIS